MADLPTGIIAVVRTRTAETARLLTTALSRTDVDAIEVTLTVPGAAEVVRDTKRLGKPTGLGTLRTSNDAALAAACADFAVSPHFDPGLTRLVLESGVPYAPGISTPTELAASLRAGCTTAKLFPVTELGGASYVRALLEPFPEAQLVVSGRVGVEDVSGYLALGVRAVCLGSALIDERALAAGDVDGLTERAARVLRLAKRG